MLPHLTDDLLVAISRLCDQPGRARLASTCRRLRDTARSDPAWWGSQLCVCITSHAALESLADFFEHHRHAAHGGARGVSSLHLTLLCDAGQPYDADFIPDADEQWYYHLYRCLGALPPGLEQLTLTTDHDLPDLEDLADLAFLHQLDLSPLHDVFDAHALTALGELTALTRLSIGGALGEERGAGLMVDHEVRYVLPPNLRDLTVTFQVVEFEALLLAASRLPHLESLCLTASAPMVDLDEEDFYQASTSLSEALEACTSLRSLRWVPCLGSLPPSVETAEFVGWPPEVFPMLNSPDNSLHHLTLTHFVDVIPPTVSSLRHLRSLVLRGNTRLSDVSALAALTALTSLSLADCQLSAVPAGLQRLTQLRHLDLSGNGDSLLTDVLAMQLPRLTQIFV